MHKFFIRTNEHYIGPFSLKEVMGMDLPPEVMIADGTPEVWREAKDIDFTQLYTEELLTIDINKGARMRGYGYDVANDPNLDDFQKGYLIHALEEYCNSNYRRPFSESEKKLLIKLSGSYHIGGLVADVKSEMKTNKGVNISEDKANNGSTIPQNHSEEELAKKREALKKKLLEGGTITFKQKNK